MAVGSLAGLKEMHIVRCSVDAAQSMSPAANCLDLDSCCLLRETGKGTGRVSLAGCGMYVKVVRCVIVR
jgi:hypothetical protein